MVVSCAAFNCTERDYQGMEISFHRFPSKNPKLEALLIQAMRREDWKPKPHSHICSKHFSKEDYFINWKGAKILKDNVVPRIFDFPKHLQRLASIFVDITKSINNENKYPPCSRHMKNVKKENVMPTSETTPPKVPKLSRESMEQLRERNIPDEMEMLPLKTMYSRLMQEY